MKQIQRRSEYMAKSPCAYCHNRSHKGYLSVKALKEHECLRKQCCFLQKLEHPYWEQRERIKEERRKKKDALSL